MADTKISALPAASSAAAADILPIVQGGATKKATVAQVRAGLAATGASADNTMRDLTVGSIGYTLQYSAPSTGATVTVSDHVSQLIVDPAGTLAALTINMPAAPVAGQEVNIAFSQIVTTLTMSGNGNTLNGGLAAATVNGFARWAYRPTNTTWYRTG